ncbi:phage tail protein [Limosilactobacillus equigenerosi]|nr:phage tail protein [Limosilactobacillus equigenerosi]
MSNYGTRTFVAITDASKKEAELVSYADLYDSFAFTSKLSGTQQISFNLTYKPGFERVFNLAQSKALVLYNGETYVIEQVEPVANEQGLIKNKVTASHHLIDALRNLRYDTDPESQNTTGGTTATNSDDKKEGVTVKRTGETQKFKLKDQLDVYFQNSKNVKYELHGNFPERACPVSDGTVLEWLNNNLSKYGGRYIMQGDTLHIYTDDALIKKLDMDFRYLYNVSQSQIQADVNDLVNVRKVYAGKMEETITTGGSDGEVGDGPTEPVNGDWGPVIRYAAQLMDVPIDDNGINLVKAQIKRESGGNEQIVQGIWDVNMANGNPAQGLLQFIPQTFNYYAVEGHKNIKSGFDQLLASFNIPNFLGQISGRSGWSPHGAPRSKTIIKPPAPKSTWGWPFRGMNGAPTSWENGQQFGHTGWVRPGSGGSDFHDGFDFGSAHYSGDILCVHGGTVTSVGYQAGFMVVTVKSSDGLTTVYQEFGNSVSVRVGQSVKTGDVIGRLTTTHLHLGITTKDFATAFAHSFDEGGGWLDPIKTIQSNGGGAKGQSVPIKKSRAQEYIEHAKTYLSPEPQVYKWGGEVKDGAHPTDCSGLWLSLALHFGIRLKDGARSTYQIIKQMRPIKRSEVQTGDAGFVPDLSHVVCALDNKTLIQESSYSEPCNTRSIDGYYKPLNWYRYDPLANVLGGEGSSDDSGGGTTTTTRTYYQIKFDWQDDESIKLYGRHVGAPLKLDDVYDEKEARDETAKQTQSKPVVSLDLDVISTKLLNKPVVSLGDKVHAVIPEHNINTDVTVVEVTGNDPYFNPDAKLKLTFNNANDALKDINVALRKDISAVRNNINDVNNWIGSNMTLSSTNRAWLEKQKTVSAESQTNNDRKEVNNG